MSDFFTRMKMMEMLPMNVMRPEQPINLRDAFMKQDALKGVETFHPSLMQNGVPDFDKISTSFEQPQVMAPETLDMNKMGMGLGMLSNMFNQQSSEQQPQAMQAPMPVVVGGGSADKMQNPYAAMMSPGLLNRRRYGL
jgi:predicted glycosyltransferase